MIIVLTEIFEKLVFVLGVDLDPLFEFWIGQEKEIGRQHHELSRGIFVLIRSIPGLAIVRHFGRPAFLQEETKVLVAKGILGIGPGTPVCVDGKKQS